MYRLLLLLFSSFWLFGSEASRLDPPPPPLWLRNATQKGGNIFFGFLLFSPSFLPNFDPFQKWKNGTDLKGGREGVVIEIFCPVKEFRS